MNAFYGKLDEKAKKLLEQSETLTPPVDLTKITEHLGLSVTKKPLEEEFSGFLAVKEKVIVINSRHASVRQRFTIAHEIGHYRLHRQKNPDSPVFIDRAVYFRGESGIDNETSHRQEMEANGFAAGLLMPRILLDEYLDKHPNLNLNKSPDTKTLADEFEVSKQAMDFRLRNLGFVLPTSF